ncbi:MAG TPA: hypothetical protein PLN24_02670 [Victivallales bacterium]|nr:hypothetical protein [Victivallales bacterium]HPO91281.1 hypothetical protein [Victivallales bacterium]
MKIICPKCKRRLEFEKNIIGNIVECSECGKAFKISTFREKKTFGFSVFWFIFFITIFAGGYYLFFLNETSLDKKKLMNSSNSRILDSADRCDMAQIGLKEAAEAKEDEPVEANKFDIPKEEAQENKQLSEDKENILLHKSAEEFCDTKEKNTLLGKSRHRLVENGDKFYIWLEAEDADFIEPSFEVDYDEGCSGGKFLSHPEDTGSAWAKNKEDDMDVPCGVGRADYTIEIPSDGDWFFWGRVKWETGCSDCFDVFIDDQKPERRSDVFVGHKFNDEMFGKDNTLDTWHWISSQVFKLKEGQHVLSLRNHDDGSHIDRILLTNDLSFRPQGFGDCHLRSEGDFSERIHKGENFYLSWFIDMKVKRGKWLAKKDRLFPDENDAEMRALILDGEDWWRNYQFTFLLDFPLSGRAGAVFYYKDDKNFYELAFEGGNMELSKTVNGDRISFGRKSFSTENRERKLSKANDRRGFRTTINRFKDRIQIYVDGVKFFDVKDESLNAGQAGFFSEWAKGFAIDDIEINSINQLSDTMKNERIEWFCNRKVRIFNSVLDSFGATGGFHPGDYSNERNEIHLKKVQELITGIEIKNKAKLLDWLWLTFDEEAFKEKYGVSKGAGYIIAQSLDNEKESFLWIPSVLYGKWDFEFKFSGNFKEFKVNLIGAYDIKNQKFHKSIDFNEKILTETENKESWQKIRISSESGKLKLYKNGLCITEYNDLPEMELRLAISIKNGAGFIDTASLYLYPSLYYDFRYNTPWRLALSDWNMFNVDVLEHGGGYYNYLILSNKNKKGQNRIISKRFFTGDFAAFIEFDIKDYNPLSIGFQNQNGLEEKIILSKNYLSKIDKIKRENICRLNNFSIDNRRFSQIFLKIKNGKLILYINDDDGTMRPIDCGSFANLLKPFNLVVSAESELRISKILIWGQEL